MEKGTPLAFTNQKNTTFYLNGMTEYTSNFSKYNSIRSAMFLYIPRNYAQATSMFLLFSNKYTYTGGIIYISSVSKSPSLFSKKFPYILLLNQSKKPSKQ